MSAIVQRLNDTHPTWSRGGSIPGLRTLAGVILSGLFAIAVYAVPVKAPAQVASIGFVLAGASALVGGLLGFLFGVPRAFQQDHPIDILPKGASNEAAGGIAQRVEYRANTNLEQISDWLTKILVGVGLTQITIIPTKFRAVASYFAPGLGGSDSSERIALAILLYFLVCGFLFGYLWTRLFLGGALRQADLSALGTQINDLSALGARLNVRLDAVSQELKDKELNDAHALSLAERQLNPVPGAAEVTQEQLNEAIHAASAPVKVQIFNRAADVRRQNWRPGGDKEKLERTIPIFRALIADDLNNDFHRTHGQLGYALKDQRKPDWFAAEAELSQAMAIRDRKGTGNWLLYEFNRAVCRIMLDGMSQRGGPSSQQVRADILQDLHAAARNAQLRQRIQETASLKQWMQDNNVTAKDLA